MFVSVGYSGVVVAWESHFNGAICAHPRMYSNLCSAELPWERIPFLAIACLLISIDFFSMEFCLKNGEFVAEIGHIFTLCFGAFTPSVAKMLVRLGV